MTHSSRTNQNIYFSRYLSSLDWRPVHLRPKSLMRALVAIANPSNLSEYQNLAPIDVEGELNRARQALGAIPITPACQSNLQQTAKNHQPP